MKVSWRLVHPSGKDGARLNDQRNPIRKENLNEPSVGSSCLARNANCTGKLELIDNLSPGILNSAGDPLHSPRQQLRIFVGCLWMCLPNRIHFALEAPEPASAADTNITGIGLENGLGDFPSAFRATKNEPARKIPSKQVVSLGVPFKTTQKRVR